MIRLGVNVDHVATLRQQRDERYPSPVQAALAAELGGADNITCHLREDRRHIQDHDVQHLREIISIPLNFEMGASDEMIQIACRIKPHFVCLVPEKREERTTEGGLDLTQNTRDLNTKVKALTKFGIHTSMFIEADDKMIDLAADLGAFAVEFHTGELCRALDAAMTNAEKLNHIERFAEAANHAQSRNLQVHLGHGLNYSNAHWLQLIPYAEEANIGHAIVARSIFVGFSEAVREMKRLLNDPSLCPR
jgi:pyridoxine 5-phosphate synthase